MGLVLPILLPGTTNRLRLSAILHAQMPTFLDRYNVGDRVEVWDDLTELGDGVRHPLYFEDAAAVAKETMRRARHNVETLIRRLDAMGYRFLDEVTAAQAQLVHFQAMDDMAGKTTSRSAAGGSVADETDARLARRKADLVKAAAKKRKDPLDDKFVFCPPDKATPKQLAKIERLARGPMPMSMRAWYEEVGGVSLMGSHPVLNPQPANENNLPDPLVMCRMEDLMEQCTEREDDDLQLMLAPDALHKADISGDAYYLSLPDRGADFVFDDGKGATFVNYLRRAFAWGGFPGWEEAHNPPRELIAQLSEGLASL
jgi:hypothetical protein